jgi:hypothetical protein
VEQNKNGAATTAAQTRVNDLKKIILEIRSKDVGQDIEEDSFIVMPRLFVDNGYMGFHVVVQVWDHKASDEEQRWNFSLWLWDGHNEYPDEEEIHCEMVHDFGDVWFSERESLVSIANYVASYWEAMVK